MSANDSKPRGPHRALVWILIVLASVVLVLSLSANWIQREVLDTDHVVDNTDQILANDDVQQALSIYLVDQLYATVDVRAQLEDQLPSNVAAISGPLAALSRQVALNVSKQALASPAVQELVARSVRIAHSQFVALIRNKGQYVKNNGGKVTIEYGAVLADLARRVGVDPDTITQIQGIVQSFSKELKQSLTQAQNQIKSVRGQLAQVQGGSLPPQLEQNLRTLQSQLGTLQKQVAGVEQKVSKAESKAPPALQTRLADLDARLSGLDARLTRREDDIAALLKNPSQADAQQLDTALASIEQRVTDLLNRPVVQNPGQLVIVDSDQLGAVQSAVGLLRNLGFVLPMLALLLYLAAIYLAHGWRRQALIAAGGGILIATLLVLLVRRVTGGAVIDSIAASDTVRPAVRAVWNVVSDGLRERALFALVIGLAFVLSGLLAGPARWAVAVRRSLAPYLRDQPVLIYSAVAVLFLVWLAFIPAINSVGQVVVIVVLAALAVVGVEVLRRQTAEEFPARPAGT